MRSRLIIGSASLAIAALLVCSKPKSAITGKVSPIDGADIVWVLSTKDSLKSGLSNGQFYFDVVPGVYKLIVDAKEPYKDVLLENLAIKADETLDVGEIVLKQ